MDTESRIPKSLRSLVSVLKFSNGNNLLHQFVTENIEPDSAKSQNYIHAVLSSFASSGEVVNSRNRDGYTALHLAVRAGNYLLVKELLSCLPNINVNAKCEQDQATPLHYAAALQIREGNFEEEQEKLKKEIRDKLMQDTENIITFLIKRGANLQSKARYGFTPFNESPKSQCLKAMKVLKECGPDVNYKGLIPLNVIVSTTGLNSQVENADEIADIIKLLMNHGADSTLKNYANLTALHIAVMARCVESVKALVENGSALEVGDSLMHTPLICASMYGTESNGKDNTSTIIKYLIENGADTNARSSCGKTALHRAVEDKCLEAIKTLVEAGIDIDCKDSYQCTPLHLAVHEDRSSIHSKRFRDSSFTKIIVKYLISSGADSNAKDKDGETPLHKAAKSFNWEAMTALVESGADVNCKDSYLHTPLHLALKENWARTKKPEIFDKAATHMVKYLISSGADLNAENVRGETPLHKAVKSQYLEAIKTLVEIGAIVDCKNKELCTPLHYAVEQGMGIHFQKKRIRELMSEELIEIIDFLISRGADVLAEDWTGRSPLHKAVDLKFWLAVKVLVKRGAALDCNDKNRNALYRVAMGLNDDSIAPLGSEEAIKLVAYLINNGIDINAKEWRRHKKILEGGI